MKNIIAFLAIVIISPLRAADDSDCTFDVPSQVRVVAALASVSPPGKIDSSKHLITWTDPVEGTTTFSYGGCFDLGSEVTRSTPRKNPRTQEQVFALARELATRFWGNNLISQPLAAETLARALDKAAFSVESAGGRTLFRLEDPAYVEFYIEHVYKAGVDRVVVSWQGNF
jgi:hypothetical protein